jgi:hypothetical protein
MGRISGTLAILAGLFLMMPGLIAMMHGVSDTATQMPAWLVRDLVATTLVGAAVLIWGGMSIRSRELELHEIPARIRIRR